VSNTRGEGRAPGEKGGRLVEDPAARRARNARLRAEEEAWGQLASPVITTFRTPEGDPVEVVGDLIGEPIYTPQEVADIKQIAREKRLRGEA
jgi:hypothetical protein